MPDTTNRAPNREWRGSAKGRETKVRKLFAKKEAGPRRAPLCTYMEVPSTGQRRPALPRASPAVPSALGGLASGFGMDPGVPRPPWPLTGGRRSAHREVVMCVRADPRALGAAQRGDGPSTRHPTRPGCIARHPWAPTSSDAGKSSGD